MKLVSANYSEPLVIDDATGERSFVVTWILSYFLGIFGVDRFYLRQYGTAVLKLLTLGGVGLWWLWDLVFTLSGKRRDASGDLLSGWRQYQKHAIVVTLVLIFVSAISGGVSWSMIDWSKY